MAKKSDFFKKIQMDLFDLLNMHPIEKFKDKDLLGPLKYLKADLEENSEVTAPSAPAASNPPRTSDSLAIMPTKDITRDRIYEDYVCDLPLVVHRKPYIRHIRFYVKPNSTVHVVAPLNRSVDLIKKEISEHRAWVEKANQSFQKLRDKFPVRFFQTGQTFPFVGENYFLKILAADFKKPFIQLDLDQLQYFYPQSWDLLTKHEKQVLLKKHLMKFYHEKAIVFLNQRLRILSEQTQLFPKRVTFRNQKTRWGSCSSDGSLNLNWKLIAFDQSLIDYVIIHELCHLKHANHSKRFWSLVESHCSDYKRLNKSLNQIQFEVDFLAPESELYLFNPTLF